MDRILFIQDPGHGWLEVSLREFPDAEEFGTGFGYINRAAGLIYLEEDCEAGAFIKAHPEARQRVECLVLTSDAACRDLPRNEERLVMAY